MDMILYQRGNNVLIKTFPFFTGYNANLPGFNLNSDKKIYKTMIKKCTYHNNTSRQVGRIKISIILTNISENCFIL